MKSWRFYLAAGFGLVFITACGGSGSDSPASPPITDSPTSITIDGPTDARVGDSVDFAVVAPSGRQITAIAWQVTNLDSPPLGAHTQAVGFDAQRAGDYVVSVELTLDDGRRLDDVLTLSVTNSNEPKAVLRLGHEATEGGRVSLSVNTQNLNGLTVTAIDWTQTRGPQVNGFSFDDGDISHNIYFQAPRVSADTIITINATLTLSNGTQLSDSASVVVKNVDVDLDGFFVNSDTNETVSSHMQPYRPDSPYASALSQCVYNNQVKSSCRFSILPLIGQETESPSVDDILDRTYVSHPWMGDAFKRFLETSQSKDDMLKLLRATTAVVISYDIRPSYYWVATGAIYLDANNFWRTPQERDTINTRPDYRSGFGSDLDFTSSWRYTKEGEYYFPILTSFNAADRLSRSNSEVEAALTWLLYHELGHANDFFDYTEWDNLAPSESPLSAYNDAAPISTSLSNALPLTSSQLHAVAQVRYGGQTATAAQRNYTALQIANWFETDGAVSFYSYYTEREDIATLFERFMMLYRLGVSADLGLFAQERIDDGSFTITWGQRNRVSDENVKPRVDYAVSRILPNLNVPDIQASLPSPIMLPTDRSWRETVSFGVSSNNKSDVVESNASHNQQDRANTLTVSDELEMIRRIDNGKYQ
ncbi:MAG: hypothetical protein VX061_10265 [Pseudomonadota bacterium]|nr:hypothetical protein [Pseudomonadota bacterium]